MNPRAYALICSAVFSLVAAAHLLRLLLALGVSVAGWSAPHWISIVGIVVPGTLASWGFTLSARSRNQPRAVAHGGLRASRGTPKH